MGMNAVLRNVRKISVRNVKWLLSRAPFAILSEGINQEIIYRGFDTGPRLSGLSFTSCPILYFARLLTPGTGAIVFRGDKRDPSYPKHGPSPLEKGGRTFLKRKKRGKKKSQVKRPGRGNFIIPPAVREKESGSTEGERKKKRKKKI